MEGQPPPPRGQPPTTPGVHSPPQDMQTKGDSAGPPHPHTRTYSTWLVDPDSPPGGRAAGEGGAPELRRPSQRQKAPPPGTPSRHPHSARQQLARAHAVGPVMGPHADINRTQDTWAAEPRQPVPRDGRPGEGQRLTPDALCNGGGPSPPGPASDHPRGKQLPAEHASQGDSAGPQHPHTHAHSTWVADPNSPP